jgi:hypothetical protein
VTPDDEAIYRAALHPARRQPEQVLRACRDHPGEYELLLGNDLRSSAVCLTQADLDALRETLGVPSGRERALASVRFLAAMDPAALREAIMVWQYESPDKALRLYRLLTGEALPAHRDPGVHDPDRGASYDRQ